MNAFTPPRPFVWEQRDAATIRCTDCDEVMPAVTIDLHDCPTNPPPASLFDCDPNAVATWDILHHDLVLYDAKGEELDRVDMDVVAENMVDAFRYADEEGV